MTLDMRHVLDLRSESGQTLASEVVALALIAFAILGVWSLLGHLL
jgi:hypothetical protein